ncbi:MAG: extracellular solute-binding protein [Oscillospiraceae bacterium]|nr:extracellular solute-binding protein [Oscillospiraceae bacterium]
MKNHFIKLVLSVILVLIIIFISACNKPAVSGTSSNDQSKTLNLDSEKGKKLTFMLPAFNYDDTNKWENKVLKEFKETYPDVTLELLSASIENWMVKLLANASGGDPIDVFQDSANNNPMYALQGINQPLQDYIDMNNPNLHMATMDAVFKYNGNYHVAVAESSVCIVYYNKDIFENEGVDTPDELYKAGKWDFDNMIRVAKELTYNNNSGKRWGLACNYPYIFFGANATSMVTLDKNYKYNLNINDPNLKYSFEVIQDAWYKSKWQGWQGTPWNSFYNGSAAMLTDFKWVEEQIIEAKNYGLCDFEYGVVPMASGPNNPKGLAPMTAFGFAMGKESDTPYHSGILIDMLINGEAAHKKETGKVIPAEHQEVYNKLSLIPFCINSYDSAVGGAFEICQAIGAGQSISQAIAEYTPIYQQKIDQANGDNK